jgi:hypothetical protein
MPVHRPASLAADLPGGMPAGCFRAGAPALRCARGSRARWLPYRLP